MDCRFEHALVAGIAAVVPPRTISIDDELAYFQDNPKRLNRAKKIIGYGTRHVVDPGVTAVDLCEAAARNLLRGTGTDPETIDVLILVNQSPDHFHPAGSCIVHGRLGLPKHCATLDVALGCSGYVHGLWLAHSLIAGGAARTVLLLAGDTPSLHSDVGNRLVNPLFGDAGTATLLVRTDRPHTAWFNLGTDGAGWHHLAIPAGGYRLPATPDILAHTYIDGQGNPWKLSQAVISGMDVFDFTIHQVPESIRAVLEHSGCGTADIDFFALHQANKQIVQAVGAGLGLPPDSMYWQTFTKYGNQSTASVACVLCDALADRPKEPGLRLLLSGFGVGLSWGSAIIDWRNVYNDGIRIFADSGSVPTEEEQIAFWKQKYLARESG